MRNAGAADTIGNGSSSTQAPPLRSRCLLLDGGPRIDPFSLAGSSGTLFVTETLVLVGVGIALSIPLHHGIEDSRDVIEVRRQLAAIESSNEVGQPGSGVVAFGALPFDRGATGRLIVPEFLYGCASDGQEWVTVVGTDQLPTTSEGLRTRLLERSQLSTSPHLTTPSITPLMSDQTFLDAVSRAVDDINRGELHKVVLARQLDVEFDSPIDLPPLLRRWHDMEPTATMFSIPVEGAQFIGASPELLVARYDDRVHCRPLAGTTSQREDRAPDPLSGSDPGLDLRTSTKDLAEHRVVVDAITMALAPLCTELAVPSTPDLLHLHSVSHLATSISGVLAAGSSLAHDVATDSSSAHDVATDSSSAHDVATVLELVSLLHPTPAVGGMPRDRALQAIEQLEAPSRAHYAGPVGWMDATGDGQWVVGIRAATVVEGRARLAAGVGVVDGSDPQAELREANWKFTAVLDALVPGGGLLGSPRPGRAVHPEG